MAAEALTCSRCQTPLPITAASFSVSCTSCGQWHLIDRSGPAPTATPFGDDAAEAPAATASPSPEAPAAAPETKVSEALQQLDQEWQWERKKYLVFGWDGNEAVPTYAAAALAALVGVGLGAILFYYAPGVKMSDRLPGLAVAAAGIGLGAYRAWQTQVYQQAYQKYQRRRRASSTPAKPSPPSQGVNGGGTSPGPG